MAFLIFGSKDLIAFLIFSLLGFICLLLLNLFSYFNKALTLYFLTSLTILVTILILILALDLRFSSNKFNWDT